MTTKLGKELDIQDYLINQETDLGAFYMACIQEDLGDGSLVRRCLYELAKAKGMTVVAKETGLTRQCLSKALRPVGRLTFETIFELAEHCRLNRQLRRSNLIFSSKKKRSSTSGRRDRSSCLPKTG